MAKRRPLLARPEIHRVLLESWRKADHWLVGRYVIMPDQLHFFCATRQVPTTPLTRWMEFWRADATRCWPHPEEKPIWQKDFFDRQLRNGESYREKWLYELENPVKAKLVTRWGDWPYQGELNCVAMAQDSMNTSGRTSYASPQNWQEREHLREFQVKG